MPSDDGAGIISASESAQSRSWQSMQSGSKPVVSSSDVSGVRVTPALTEIERNILDFMVFYLRTNTYQPSIREIGREFGIKSTKTVSEHLQSLADKGFVERDPSRSRGVRILGVDLNAQTVSLPCFRDLREAGNGIRTEGAGVHISLDRQLVGKKGGFMVRAPVGQLADAGIVYGDFLVVTPVLAEELADGEVIVARVGDIPDYFRISKAGSRIFLHPVGGEGAPTDVEGPASLVLMGRVSALYRRVGPLSFTAPVTAH